MRKLPVIQSQDSDDAVAASRPPTHWIAIGAGFVISIWMPLLAVVLWAGARWPLGAAGGNARDEAVSRALVQVLLVTFSFATACAAGGAAVGRFGGRAQRREGALAAMVAALVVWALALVGGAMSPWPFALISLLSLLVLAALFGWLGGVLGERRRPRV